MPIIFRKTAKGQTEIETRTHRLPPRMRSALILVDGRRDSNDLRALIPQSADDLLGALEQQGFIEAVGETAPRSPPPVRATAPGATAAEVASESRLVTIPADIDLDSMSVIALRQRGARLLNEALGPTAAALVAKVEKASSLEELRQLLTQGAQLVNVVRGRAAAATFVAKFPEFE